jgi:hypothetical protein
MFASIAVPAKPSVRSKPFIRKKKSQKKNKFTFSSIGISLNKREKDVFLNHKSKKDKKHDHPHMGKIMLLHFL